MNSTRFSLLAVCLAILLPACGLTKPEVKPRGPQGTVSVKVEAHSGGKAAVYLAVFPTGGGKELDSKQVTDGSVTGFILPADQEYEVRAFVDRNGDGKPGAGEPIASVKNVKPDQDVHAAPQVVVLDISATAGAGALPNTDKKPAAAPEIDKPVLPKTEPETVKEAAPGPPVPPPPGTR